ncbi:uncharacterized protein LOC124282067 [Haliotis rubra]|uniref:uncharacterized protein LOC124282067 n=1 Tax=Haliotis rubra TaxID=36100 RepID=UPI001EE532BE|nr:uncharacterized protein LOC124282067 [Haliotis rubra]
MGVFQSPHGSWDTNQYVSAILPPVGLVLVSVLLLVAFCVWRRRSGRSEKVTVDDQIGLFVINVPCNRNLNRADSVASFRQDASLCPEGDTSLDFDEAQVVTFDTVCDEISNTQPTTEDVTLDPLSIQGSSVSDNARLSDVATPGTRRHVTSLDPEGLLSVIVSPDDHAPLGDFGTPDTHRHVTSYAPPGVLPCTSGGGLPETNSYDPLNRCEEEDEECTVVDDNNVGDISEENPYVDLVVLKR